ncbi:DNA-directed RNA polymerase sigma-70 factor [Gluconacetobacter liquefaciens]|uniref:RNA polymerase sigma factor n=1 Tax=Gluconacetobacter liquefaciens TaxID=89584 RepID=A0A370FWZ2_GLULI|nr:RNA polymerase sigma factor [Gluconacetobacter liquefaciens]MBB2187918.1 RNA polymerase sigma factor [Gluconacetobacter liquefaciens]RDI34198.1 RNA polymerase sigma-70 factor (ECF subfamily) [Gluconacetobacter liquefaciens]GBR02297.1 RNA polymerase sigma-24 factor [Gluconacetobacter liquefaciens NRIC 0522]GEB38841.1 DNA-directed RNA polymerase sigma-70 factor [Gluconacetobacter liquefaciens]
MNAGSRSWPEIFSEQRSGLLRFLFRKVGNHALAEDLTHDVWVRIARRHHPEMPDSPAKYLYRIASNLALDHLRRDTLQIEIQADERQTGAIAAPNASPEEIAIQRDQLERLRAAVETLPPRCREVFILAKLEGLSYQRVADRLGISRNTVVTHMVTALAALDRALAQEK